MRGSGMFLVVALIAIVFGGLVALGLYRPVSCLGFSIGTSIRTGHLQMVCPKFNERGFL